MFEPIYSLPLVSTGVAGEFKASYGGGGGSGGWASLPLGGSFVDAFKKNLALTPRQLIQELIGIAYACVDLNSNTVAATPLRLYVRTGGSQSKCRWETRKISPARKSFMRSRKGRANHTNAIVGGGDDIEEITDPDHPINALLRKPEPTEDDLGLSAFDHRYMTNVYLESLGRAYWYIGERDAVGNPKFVRLLRSHLVREVPDVSGDRILAYYEYGGTSGARYRPDEIIKFHIPDPFHPHLNGYSPLQAAIEKIRISRKEDAHINALLENMGRPDAVWSPRGDSEGGGIGTAEASRVRSAFRQSFAQAGRGGLMVSEVPGQLDILGWKPQDVVELERAKAIKTDVLNVFGVPDAKLERNAANLASAKTADEAHAKDTILPRCIRNEETLNSRLVPLYDDSGRLFLAYDSPIPDDEVFQLEITKTGGQLGVATINQSLASIGLPPVDGDLGDCRTLANNLLLIKPDGTILQSAIPPTPSAPGNPPGAETKSMAILDRLTAIMERIEIGQVSHKAMEAGHWVTMEGQHVFIGNSSGRILKGPAHLVGKKPGELKIAEHHRGHTNPKKPPKEKPRATRTKEPKPSAKAARAKAAHRMIAKEDQNYAKDLEPEVAKQLGGASFPDSEPVDVVIAKAGVVAHGIEVKRLMLQDTDEKLTMNKYAQVRKIVWEGGNDATYHTVVVDDRKIYNANGEGMHGDEKDRSYYYRRGVAGSARLGALHPVKSIAEVKKLMAMPESELPAAAQRTDGKLREGKWKPLPDKEGRGFVNSKTGEVVRPKK